jgi:hypothetical protein
MDNRDGVWPGREDPPARQVFAFSAISVVAACDDSGNRADEAATVNDSRGVNMLCLLRHGSFKTLRRPLDRGADCLMR